MLIQSRSPPRKAEAWGAVEPVVRFRDQEAERSTKGRVKAR
jgi:hypothetical protein